MRERTNARVPRSLLWLGALSLLLAVAGCKTTATTGELDEGVTDYRKATIDQNSAKGDPTDVTKKYRLSDEGSANQNPDVPITPSDTFYVSLLQAFIGPDGEFAESRELGRHDEIAIVLRVRDSNDPLVPCRFVFYSDDVAHGQFLNFSNLLTLGPTIYRGGVVTIDVDEIRVTGPTADLVQRLKQLAGAQNEAFGPDPNRAQWNAEVRDVFDRIEHDIYTTRYTLTLLPSGGVKNLPYARFEAGNYVLMRHQSRDKPFEWNALSLDNNTGRLVYKGSHSDDDGTATVTARNSGTTQDACGTCIVTQAAPTLQGDYRQRSYVTLQINALRGLKERPPQEVRSKVDPPSYKSLDRAVREECTKSSCPPKPPHCKLGSKCTPKAQ